MTSTEDPATAPNGSHGAQTSSGASRNTSPADPAAPGASQGASRQAPAREAFRAWHSIATRWMDGDPYGHVNNAQYHSYIDTVVTFLMLERGVLGGRLWTGRGLAVETHCAFYSPISFPSVVEGGLKVGHLGRSSVRYEVGLFVRGQAQAAAFGHLVHVYVDPQTRRPMPLPDQVRQILSGLH